MSAPGERSNAVGKHRIARPSGQATSAGLRLMVPIALKFTVFIAILVVAFMAWQTFTAIRVAQAGLDREINRSGVLLATALATLIDPRLVEHISHQKELQSALAGFLSSPGAAHVLDVLAYDSEGGAMATGSGKSRFARTLGRTVADAGAAAAGVEILEFSYEGKPVRSFSRHVLSADGAAPPGRIEVNISAAEIEESRVRLAAAMTRVSTTACIVAALGAFLLARFLTRPIRILVKDMKHVSLGDLKHTSRVKSSDELGELAHAFNTMTAGLQAAQDAKLAQRALEHELSLATRTQARLLPSTIPREQGLDIAVHYAPAREVGGDYYDFVKIDEHLLGAVVADVSGKGIPASLIMTMTRSLLRMAARGESQPARTVELVHRFLVPDMNPGMFVTLVYLVIDLESREVRLVRAGHNAPLLHSTRHGKILRLQPRGIGLGLDRGGDVFHAELQVQRFTLQPGDVLVLYTDGVVEGKSREGKDYSDERFEEVISAAAAGTAAEIVQAVVSDLARHERGIDPSDDVTLVVFKVR